MNVHADKEGGVSGTLKARIFFGMLLLSPCPCRVIMNLTAIPRIPCLRKQAREPLGQGQQQRHIVLIFNGRHPATCSDF